MQKNVNFMRTLLLILFILSTSVYTFSQTKKSMLPVKKTSSSVAGIKPEPLPDKIPLKKNERPGVEMPDKSNDNKVRNTIPDSLGAVDPTYFYEFSRPDFLISKIFIEHDESGKGKISFLKKGNDEMITDPIQLSPTALARINTALTALDFLNSDASYQHEKDFPHLGTIKFRLNKAGRDRNTTFNWTENRDAKILMDEYRKIANQFVWIFDISVARENQPLESPKLLDSLESLIRRNEISDSAQMAEFLRILSNDERIPLIARNHAGRLISKIGKEKK